MTDARKMLMETLAGHLALLQTAHPRKAATPVAMKTKQFVRLALRPTDRRRLAA